MKYNNKSKQRNFFYTLLCNVSRFKIVNRKKHNDLNHFKDSLVGSYVIDRNPSDVSYDWIVYNNFIINEP